MTNNDLTDKVERMTDVSGYQTVDVLGYNPTTKNLGLKVNGADTVIPFSSGLEEETLWTNSSPTSSFASQNFTVSGGTSTYKGFCIYWKYRDNDSSHTSASKTYNLTSGAQACGCVNYGVSNAFTFRECTISSISSASTTFKFGNGFGIASGSIGGNNVYCIPIKITGLK